MPPTNAERALKITSTETFRITHPSELRSIASSDKIKRNLSVLQKMIPEMKKMKERPVRHWICP